MKKLFTLSPAKSNMEWGKKPLKSRTWRERFAYGASAEDAGWNSLQSSDPDTDPDPHPNRITAGFFVFSSMESSVKSIF